MKWMLGICLAVGMVLAVWCGILKQNNEATQLSASLSSSPVPLNQDSHLDISFEETLTAINNRDSLVFTEVPEDAIPPSNRYRIEFTATKAEDYPYRPFDHYHVNGWIVTAPEGVVYSADFEPAAPIHYIKGWSSHEKEQRTGIEPGFTHREGIMYLTLEKKLVFVRNRFKAASLSVTEQWSVNEKNTRKRVGTMQQASHTAPIYEQFHFLRALGFLASEKMSNPTEQRQEVFLRNKMLRARHIIQTSEGNKVAVQCDKDWPSLVRQLEVFRGNQQHPSWSVTTDGAIHAGALILPESGKWITYTDAYDENLKKVRYESFWQVNVIKAEALPPQPFHEWPEYLEAMKIIDEAKN